MEGGGHVLDRSFSSFSSIAAENAFTLGLLPPNPFPSGM